jgi:hypothetical protein
MIGRIVILFLGLTLIPNLCPAEFYKYRDANGVLRFTDNLLEVPEDQREQVQEYKEIVTPEEKEEPVKKVPIEDLNARATDLNAERDVLAKEYAELAKDRAELEKQTRDPQNQEEYAAYLKMVEDYNARIRAYEAKRKLFQEKVDAFNADAQNQDQ